MREDDPSLNGSPVSTTTGSFGSSRVSPKNVPCKCRRTIHPTWSACHGNTATLQPPLSPAKTSRASVPSPTATQPHAGYRFDMAAAYLSRVQVYQHHGAVRTVHQRRVLHRTSGQATRVSLRRDRVSVGVFLRLQPEHELIIINAPRMKAGGR